MIDYTLNAKQAKRLFEENSVYIEGADGFSTVPNQIISRKPHNCGFFLSNFPKNFVVYVVCRCIMWYNGYINLRCVRNLKTETVLST